MSDSFQTTPPRERRREEHSCKCGARFEVGLYGDPLDATATVDVRCPRCAAAHTISVPPGTENDLLVELSRGPEPETGGGD
jgi:hypothetical protein